MDRRRLQQHLRQILERSNRRWLRSSQLPSDLQLIQDRELADALSSLSSSHFLRRLQRESRADVNDMSHDQDERDGYDTEEDLSLPQPGQDSFSRGDESDPRGHDSIQRGNESDPRGHDSIPAARAAAAPDFMDDDEDDIPSPPPDSGPYDAPLPTHAPAAAAAAPAPAAVPHPLITRYDSIRKFYDALVLAGVIEYDNGIKVNLATFANIWRDPHAMSMFTTPLIEYIVSLMRNAPHMAHFDRSNGTLIFQFPYCHNLKRSILLYLLHYLSILPVGNNHVFTTTEGPLAPATRIGDIVIPSDRRITFNKLMTMFISILSQFQMYSNTVWNDTEDFWVDADSGEVLKLVRGEPITLKLTSRPGFLISLGTKWNDEMRETYEKYLSEGGYFCIMNKDDDLCFVYTIIIGLAMIGDPRLFPRGMKYISIETLNRNLNNAVIQRNWGLDSARLLLHRLQNREDGDAIDKIGSEMLKNLTTKEAVMRLRTLESELIKDSKKAGIDVYVLRIGESGTRRIFPCYLSENNPEHRIPIVNIEVGSFNHFCYVTNIRSLFKQTGGKIFEVCSKCHQAFYSRYAFQKHKCDKGDDMYAWSDCSTPSDYPIFAGVCERCHLKFLEEETYEYHKRHCFMRHRSGNRFVKVSDVSTISYTPVDKDEKDPDSLANRKLYFADFECTINSEGRHDIMSYGIFDPDSEEYCSGYSLDEFMNKVIEYSKKHKEIQVMFHNAMNYDANFILRYVLDKFKDWSINVIMKSSSKLHSLKFLYQDGKTKRRIRIGDTYQFIGLSLDRIVKSAKKETIEDNWKAFPFFFRQLQRRYPFVHEDHYVRILQKNLFPYKFFDDSSKLDTRMDDFEKIFLPVSDNLRFFSESVTVEDLEQNYGKFIAIVDLFDLKTARDYHDLYLLCDVLQIADVFIQTRQLIKSSRGIDITRFSGMPGATWAAFWKFNPDLKLPLYTASIQAEFFASMIRGGVTSAPLRYSEADDTHSIVYLDVNGLYPYVMQKYKYPCGSIFWVNFSNEPHKTLIEKYGPQDYFMNHLVPDCKLYNRGYCLAVDLEIPESIHNLTDQFPFAPTHEVLHDCYYDENGEMYPFLKTWSRENANASVKPFIGLVGTLNDKKEYGVHWKLLKWYVKHGARITKLYHGCMFNEGYYLRDYVAKNIRDRNACRDEMSKMMYKLLGNALYGKTFEDTFNRCQYLIVRNKDKITGLLEEGNVAAIYPIDEENSIVKIDGSEVVLDKPTYIGACVTEYAKLHMYKLFYDKILRIFPGTLMNYTDTDSFILTLLHRPGMTPKEIFDYIEEQCPGLIGSEGGQLKSETGQEVLIKKVIALRSKLYAYMKMNGEIDFRMKGVSLGTRRKQVTWETFENALYYHRSVVTTNVEFERIRFTLSTKEKKKIGINIMDLKRYIFPDGIHTRAWRKEDLEKRLELMDLVRKQIDDEEEEEEEEEVQLATKRMRCDLI